MQNDLAFVTIEVVRLVAEICGGFFALACVVYFFDKTARNNFPAVIPIIAIAANIFSAADNLHHAPITLFGYTIDGPTVALVYILCAAVSGLALVGVAVQRFSRV